MTRKLRMFLEILIFTKVMKGEELTWKIVLSAKRIAEKPLVN